MKGGGSQRNLSRLLRGATAVACVVALMAGTPCAIGAGVDGRTPLDAGALARVIGESVGVAGGGGLDRRQMLRQLRALRDPALEPLFSQLSASNDDELRVQGVLGAAECSPAGLSLLMLRRVERPEVRRALVTEAVRGGLLDRAGLENLVRWPDVEGELLLEVAVALLAGGGGGEVVPRDRLAACARSADAVVAVTGALVHLWLWPGEGVEGVEGGVGGVFERRAADLVKQPRERVAGVLELVRARRGVGCQGLVKSMETAIGDSDWELGVELARVRLVCWPGEDRTAERVGAVRAWAEGTSRDAGTGLGVRVRLAMAAVESAAAGGSEGGQSRLPDSVLAAMLSDASPLVSKLASAAQACDIGCGSLEERVLACLDEGHAPSAEMVLQLAAGRGEAVLSAARGRVLERVDAATGSAASAWARLAQREAGAMARTNPDEYRRQLKVAVDGGFYRRSLVMVLGVLEGRVDGLATLLEPVGGASLDASGKISGRERDVLEGVRDLALVRVGVDGRIEGGADAGGGAGGERGLLAARLERLALGQGGLPQPMRVRAAWVALRLAGEDRAGLSRVLAGVETP